MTLGELEAALDAYMRTALAANDNDRMVSPCPTCGGSGPRCTGPEDYCPHRRCWQGARCDSDCIVAARTPCPKCAGRGEHGYAWPDVELCAQCEGLGVTGRTP
jgi:hypothetical protein